MNESGRIAHSYVETKQVLNGRGPREIIEECLQTTGRNGKLKIELPDVKVIDGENVFYELVVEDSKANVRWTLYKRFQEFFELNEEIESRVRSAQTLPPFPEKAWKMFTDHTERCFIEERKAILLNYLRKLNEMSRIRSLSACFIQFLEPHHEDDVKRVEYADQNTRKKSMLDANVSSYTSPEVTGVKIPAAQILKRDHVVYQIQIENINKRDSFQRWSVLRRFVEFRQLDAAIREELEANNPFFDLTSLPELPARQLKVLVDHLQVRFIERRRLLLELYLRKLIHIEAVCGFNMFLKFLGCV